MPSSRVPQPPPSTGLGSAAWVLAALVVLALVLVLRGSVLAALILPLAGWLGWRLMATSAAPSAPPVSGGPADRLVARLLPLWSAQIGTAQRQLNEGIEASLQCFQHMLAAQEKLSPQLPSDGPAGEALHEMTMQGDAALAALQVGDRVQQMLDVIKQDQQRLAALLAQPDALDDQDTDRWLAELQARYTTQEQRDTHDGRAPAADGTAGVQYF